jgi:hypothetical protein
VTRVVTMQASQAELMTRPGTTRGRPSGEVREVALPPEALTLATLARVDYTDSFRLELPRVRKLTGEEWARAILEDAPPSTRTMLRRGWFALGVRLGSPEDERLVLGWPVRRRTSEFALLATSSRLGMEAEVLLKREREALLVATLMQLKNPIARAVWTRFSPQHRRVVRHLLREAGRRACNEP